MNEALMHRQERKVLQDYIIPVERSTLDDSLPIEIAKCVLGLQYLGHGLEPDREGIKS